MSKSVVTALSVLLFASCSHTDLHDPDAADEAKKAQEEALIQQKKQEYEANFVKKFGAVDPNQSWDFSSGMPAFSLPAAASRGVTRAGEYQRTNSERYYEFQDATISKMKTVFKEGENHVKSGKPFYMTVPENAFTIMPMYMGTSSGKFDLYMHVDGIGDIKVWSKWDDIQVKGRGYNPQWIDVKKFDSSANCTNATAIRSKYYTFKGLPVGASMYFYLKITETAYGYNQEGQVLGSLNDHMREYKFQGDELPTNLPDVENAEVMIIGCEDASANSDWDYNDVVFMIFGEPYVPQTFTTDVVRSTYSKRYMIEDLGATDDFDFNDVVVDVYATYEQTYTVGQTGHVEWNPVQLKEQKAIVRHLGGVLPFDLTIGNTTLRTMGSKETFQTSPNEEFEIEGWDRETNNISVKVYQSAGSQIACEVNFPQRGAVPMIIATDTNVEWAVERVEFNWESYMPEAE